MFFAKRTQSRTDRDVGSCPSTDHGVSAGRTTIEHTFRDVDGKPVGRLVVQEFLSQKPPQHNSLIDWRDASDAPLTAADANDARRFTYTAPSFDAARRTLKRVWSHKDFGGL